MDKEIESPIKPGNSLNLHQPTDTDGFKNDCYNKKKN